MSIVAQHAIGLARQGAWRLADALELVSRAQHDKTIAGIVHQVGAEAVIGFAAEPGEQVTEVDCPECDGDGETSCCECGHAKVCTQCFGEGVVDLDLEDLTAGDCVRWETLSGEPRAFRDGTSNLISLHSFMTVSQARQISLDWGRLAVALAPPALRNALGRKQAGVLAWLQVAA